MEGKIVFITGGARSGKTSFAEKCAEKIAKEFGSSLYYIATSKKEDLEMEDRINRHQEDRQRSDASWQTIEQPVEIEKSAEDLTENSIALLDCITLLLSNELFKEDFDEELFKEQDYQDQVKKKIVNGIIELSKDLLTLFVVTNEVLYDPLDPQNEVVWVYQKLLGEIHQELVAHSHEAYLVEAGIPISKK